jgi:hypothetical protein
MFNIISRLLRSLSNCKVYYPGGFSEKCPGEETYFSITYVFFSELQSHVRGDNGLMPILIELATSILMYQLKFHIDLNTIERINFVD